jgi:hypothetical protein
LAEAKPQEPSSLLNNWRQQTHLYQHPQALLTVIGSNVSSIYANLGAASDLTIQEQRKALLLVREQLDHLKALLSVQAREGMEEG